MARASLEELRLDYEDYLRHHGLAQWLTDDSHRAELTARRCTTTDAVAQWVQEVHRRPASSRRPTYQELAANAALVLIEVACALLDRQIAAQATAFSEEGGFTERLYRIRSERRRNSPKS